MSSVSVPVVAIGMIGSLIVSMCFSTLPYPYEAYTSQQIPQDKLDLLPGGRHPPTTTLYDAFSNEDKDAWLSSLRLLFEGQLDGVESVGVSPYYDGALILLDKYGFVNMAFPADKGLKQDFGTPDKFYYELNPPNKWTKLYIGPGRPLGYHVMDNGIDVLVCDSLKGLIQVNLKHRTVEILSNFVPTNDNDTSPINYANDLDVGPISGNVYFSSSTSGVVGYNSNLNFYDTLRACFLNFFRGDVSGRLLRYNPTTKQTDVLLDKLFYANGVAVSRDESYVLVVETFAFRVLRLWLQDTDQGNGKIQKAGTVDVFIDQLPGAPDGLSRSWSDPDCFWICIVSKISPLFKLAPYPLLRQLISHVAIPLLPKVGSKVLGSTAAIRVQSTNDAAAAKVIDVYLDSTSSKVRTISGVTEYNGAVFFGSLGGNYVSVLPMEQNK